MSRATSHPTSVRLPNVINLFERLVVELGDVDAPICTISRLDIHQAGLEGRSERV